MAYLPTAVFMIMRAGDSDIAASLIVVQRWFCIAIGLWLLLAGLVAFSWSLPLAFVLSPKGRGHHASMG